MNQRTLVIFIAGLSVSVSLSATLLACADVSDNGDAADSETNGEQISEPSQISKTIQVPVDDENCPLGGTKTVKGTDDNDNGALDDDEIKETIFDCCVLSEEATETICDNRECGAQTVPDSCGNVHKFSCGTCVDTLCNEEIGRCEGCLPLTCNDQEIHCGEAYDGCGNFIQCGEPCDPNDASQKLRLRLLAGNLSTTKKGVCSQCYDGEEGIRIFQGLKPDVAMIQEFNYGDNTPDALREMVDVAFGKRFFYRVQPRVFPVKIPNAIVSYYPIKEWGILEDENVSDRSHVWARLDIPGPHDLWVVSVHFPTKGTLRKTSIPQLMNNLANLNIPKDDYVAIGGDFNTTSRTNDEGLRKLDDTKLVVLDNDHDCPIDQNRTDEESQDKLSKQSDNTNLKRTKDYDAIYTSQNLKDLRITVKIGSAQNLSHRGLVFDSRVFTPLSEVFPVKKTDSEAPDMQHMAVIKDFGIFH